MTSDALICAYESLVDQGVVQFHARQFEVVQILQSRLEALTAREDSGRGSSFFSKVHGLWKKPDQIPGLYIYGSVGTGKTMLLDLFFEHLPAHRKKRYHFHEFMVMIQKELLALRGQVQDPLTHIAKRFRSEADVLCFDEFYVDHIADAMLIKKLFEQWFESGLFVLATSNVAPDRLYEKGVNRELFLPFVYFLKERMQVEDLTLSVDFRRTKEAAHPGQRVWSALTRKTHQEFKGAYEEVAGCVSGAKAVEIGGRSYQVQGASGECVWAKFQDLCDIYASSHDYLKLTEPYQNWFVSEVPVFDEANHDQAKRFRTLIDILYERNARLWIQCEASVDALNQIPRFSGFFKRTESRIFELTRN